ncbi:uncharacterized protein E0L32_005429 [Thyridium curvatum]|uniref:Uncharacterized protein n=1 Tax=Thyridium curvatum TaxID=1093900 RepID=A0A507AUI1_9PEZI|nr:uncharacterized protein E0L32_005429 [Thyridium curvatum]TPX14465.1 hypothetical protein E0L32_005429 [Thyridium curvatum]
MFSRAVSGGFVCLRCQLQRSRPVHATRILPLASHSQLRRNGTESDSGDGGADQDAERAIPIEKEPVGRVSRKDAPTNRSKDRVLYRSKGRRVTMKGETLGIDILGKPAEAIVMKEHSKIRRRDSPLGLDNYSSLDNAIRQIDAENLFSEEGVLVTPERVQEHIEELRPVEDTILSKAEFDRIRDVLIQGFTTAQLQQYIRENGGQAVPGAAESTVPNAPWIVHYTPWTPEADARMPANLRGYISSSLSPKQKVATRLMRLSWDLSILELTSAMGHVDVQLREPEFSLLVLGGQSWLADISRHYLREGMHIELFRTQKTMRVIAPRAVADTVFQEVDTRLHNAVTEKIKVTDITNSIPSQLLQEVGRITNSIVSLSSSGKEVEVTFLQNEVQDAYAQSPKDVVFRLLLTACSPSSSQSQLHQLDSDDTESARFIEDYGNSGKWAWRHRLSKWARWTSATTMTWTDHNKSHVIPPAALKWNIQPSPKGDDLATQDGWPGQLTTATSATFGHVLHKLPPNGTRLELANGKNKRIMSPIIPPLTTISLPSEPVPGSKNVTIVMHFVPRPSSTRSAAAAPHLELRLDAADARILTTSSLRAITAKHVSDVVLPHNRVDIRLNQTRYAELIGSDAVVAAVPTIHSYISHSRLELGMGSLETPALLGAVKIPRRLLGETGRGRKSGPPRNGHVELDYMFAGLEFHRSVAASFERWVLCYTSIEAGQGGGRRAELSLQAVQAGEDSSASADEANSAAFLRAALKASGCKELTWVGENWKDK